MTPLTPEALDAARDRLRDSIPPVNWVDDAHDRLIVDDPPPPSLPWVWEFVLVCDDGTEVPTRLTIGPHPRIPAATAREGVAALTWDPAA